MLAPIATGATKGFIPLLCIHLTHLFPIDVSSFLSFSLSLSAFSLSALSFSLATIFLIPSSFSSKVLKL
jgi:hypothetical protein